MSAAIEQLNVPTPATRAPYQGPRRLRLVQRDPQEPIPVSEVQRTLGYWPFRVWVWLTHARNSKGETRASVRRLMKLEPDLPYFYRRDHRAKPPRPATRRTIERAKARLVDAGLLERISHYMYRVVGVYEDGTCWVPRAAADKLKGLLLNGGRREDGLMAYNTREDPHYKPPKPKANGRPETPKKTVRTAELKAHFGGSDGGSGTSHPTVRTAVVNGQNGGTYISPHKPLTSFSSKKKACGTFDSKQESKDTGATSVPENEAAVASLVDEISATMFAVPKTPPKPWRQIPYTGLYTRDGKEVFPPNPGYRWRISIPAPPKLSTLKREDWVPKMRQALISTIKARWKKVDAGPFMAPPAKGSKLEAKFLALADWLDQEDIAPHAWFDFLCRAVWSGKEPPPLPFLLSLKHQDRLGWFREDHLTGKLVGSKAVRPFLNKLHRCRLEVQRDQNWNEADAARILRKWFPDYEAELEEAEQALAEEQATVRAMHREWRWVW